MANIVKINSLSFESVLTDVLTYLAKTGDLDLTDFYADAAATRLASSIAGLYKQLQAKLDSNRREAVMNSAQRDESIEYLALSQTNYNPKRKVAPQHTEGHWITFDSLTTSGLTQRDVIGTIKVDDTDYSISVIKDFELTGTVGTTNSYRGKMGIGSWRKVEITVDEDEGHLDPFHIFTIDEDKYVIDDSGTIKITLEIEGSADIELTVIDSLYDVTQYNSDELQDLVLVKTNFFGGIDLNFGDSVIFGNALLESRGEYAVPTKIIVEYFVTQGYIPNFSVQDSLVSYDSNFLTANPVIDPVVANGIDQESVNSIKTLAPQMAVSQNRIITQQDLKAAVERIPTIKSAYAGKEVQESIAEWVNGTTYSRGDVRQYLGISYVVASTGFLVSTIAPSSDSDNWIQLPVFDDRLNNATFLLYALVPKNVPTYSSSTTYSLGDYVIWNEIYWRCTAVTTTEEPSSTATDWAEDSFEYIDEFEPLTQEYWELDFYEQYGFDTSLGFMRVVVLPPTAISQNFDLTIILDRSVDVQSKSQSEIDSDIRDIIDNYIYTLGVKMYVGDIVSQINDIEGVSKVYLNAPVSNRELGAGEYFTLGTVSIDYTTEDSFTNKFGS